MARSLTTATFGAVAAPASDVQSITALISGSTPGAKVTIHRGKEFSEPRFCNIGVFGDQGTGKTEMIVSLLLEGLKVYGINSDFGGCGFDTVHNRFDAMTPDKHALRDDNFVSIRMNYKGVVQFMRDPASLDPGIYDFDPDIIFWDGFTAFQQADLEGYIADEMDPVRSHKNKDNVEQHREEGLFLEQADWGMIKNGTLKPLNGFFNLHNVKTGKPWSKAITFLEDKKDDWVDGKRVDNSGKSGPMIHGASRKLVGAACSIMLQTKKTEFGNDVQYKYISRGPDLMIKDRSYGLPAEMQADAGLLWREYIAPRIKWVSK